MKTIKSDRESNVAKSQFIYEIDTQACAPVEHCGNIGRIDYDSETDGPLYYFDLQSEEVVSTCGGVCLAPTGDQAAVCETMCPTSCI
ncbi:Uncharacterised protein [BD1-7 clade bacterium]|uniref:Uncharacterized protein n=1 Tax=BD1-7 clade bacterium TaxID=2029982 RepID=A0A5S9R0Y5_9GAMM|nr:Uncharacterised protein [BD1-7 clade bacterium]